MDRTYDPSRDEDKAHYMDRDSSSHAARATPEHDAGLVDETATELADDEAQDCHGDDPGRFVTADGALLLAGSDTLTLGSGPHRFTRICVRDQARLAVCNGTILEISGHATSVIAGRGIGPVGGKRAAITIRSSGKATLAVLFDNIAAPVRATFDAPGAPEVYIALTGKTGLELNGGPLQRVITSPVWGDTSSFPACGATPASIAQ